MGKNIQIQSLVRGLKILQLVASTDDGLTAKEISEALQITRPTAHNLAITLLSEGFLSKLDKPTRYRLGPIIGKLNELSTLETRHSAARKSIRQLITDFHGIDFIYAEPKDDCMVMIWKSNYGLPSMIEQINEVAISHPYNSSLGFLFHAFADKQQVSSLRKRLSFEEFGLPFWKNKREFEKYIEKIRKQGCISQPWSLNNNTFSIAYPVFDENSTLIGALGAAFQKQTCQSMLAKAIKQEALHLSTLLFSKGQSIKIQPR